jgi:prepilin-type N-terminal cleavage/methylation domain-containing protein/prepilin-type processing-associated H-X9-DG protein
MRIPSPPFAQNLRSPESRADSGFTLIELLTVIAIIGILAAILIPTVSRVREHAKSARCGSNLRQIATAFQLYANEHAGFLPDRAQNAQYENLMRVVLAPYFGYTGPDTHGPSDPLGRPSGIARCPSGPPTWGFTYYPNFTLWSTSRKNMNTIQNPSRIVLHRDRGGIEIPGGAVNVPGQPAWHGGGVRYNVVFLDGHVGPRGFDQLKASLMEEP